MIRAVIIDLGAAFSVLLGIVIGRFLSGVEPLTDTQAFTFMCGVLVYTRLLHIWEATRK